MLKSIKVLSIAAAMTLTAASAAQAATFDFSTGAFVSNNLGADEVFTADGIQLTVTANGGDLVEHEVGLGVSSVGLTPTRATLADNLMSGAESLTLAFNPSVNILKSIIFESVTGTDVVTLKNLSDNSTIAFTLTDDGGTGGNKIFEFDVTGDAGFNNTGSLFSFQTTSSTGRNPGVLISSVTVSPVPVPASLPFLVAGLGGLAFMRRRKKT